VRLGVLASGTGTLLEAFLREGVPVAMVLVDRPCRAEAIAAEAGVALERCYRESFGADFDRHAYTLRLLDALDRHGVGLVAMAGFGTVLAPIAFDVLQGRILNTHPSLLPAFKGWHAVEEALAAGVAVTGCTVHVATAEVDEGPILAQEEVPVLPGDTPATLHERIKTVERRLYPAVVRALLDAVPREGPAARPT
jgi:phosphoribosylglycinamide formyltransferase-1